MKSLRKDPNRETAPGAEAPPSSHPSGRAVGHPKRGQAERRGLHAWLPYYAGFSEAFVHKALRELGIEGDQVVVDPMNGSGTTTVVTQQLGVLSIGVELNPTVFR